MNQLLLDLEFETTAKGLFDHIVKIFEKTNIDVGVTTFYTFISMMSLQWDGKLPIAQHISAISSVNAQLTSMRKGFDDETLAFLLLHSLPKNSTWENFTASVLGSLPNGDVLSFCTMSNQLITEDVRHSSNARIESEAVLKAAKANNVKSQPKMKLKADKWCSHHNATSHNTDNCFTLKKLRQEEEKGGKGNSADKRRSKNRGRKKAHKAKGGSEYDSDTSESEEQVHVTTALKRCIGAYLGWNCKNDPSGILLDSGASTTMTPNREWFHLFTPLNLPRKVHFRDDLVIRGSTLRHRRHPFCRYRKHQTFKQRPSERSTGCT